VKNKWLLALALALIVAGFVLTRLVENRYVYFAAYAILQYIVLATAWNILGGYAGYVNFGTGAFFALGAYTASFSSRRSRRPHSQSLPVVSSPDCWASGSGISRYAFGACSSPSRHWRSRWCWKR
jgi:ABC-type branched-subunit amino acid transport system permease subunit